MKLKEMFEDANERSHAAPPWKASPSPSTISMPPLINANGALVDITAKSSAYASIHSLKHVAEAGIVSGFHEEFVIIGENEVDDSLIFQYDLAWERCRQLQAEDVVLKRKAVGANKGAVVSWRVSVKSTAEELLERNLWRLMGKHID